MFLDWKTTSGPHYIYKEIMIPVMNYSGVDFAAAVQLGINNAMNAIIYFEVSYALGDNMLTIKQLDHFEVLCSIVSSADLQLGFCLE